MTNAIEQVTAVRAAELVVRQWDPSICAAVLTEMPATVRQRKTDAQDWLVTVEVLRRGYETPVAAAERLARYLDLHAERWGDTPTLNAIRRTV